MNKSFHLRFIFDNREYHSDIDYEKSGTGIRYNCFIKGPLRNEDNSRTRIINEHDGILTFDLIDNTSDWGFMISLATALRDLIKVKPFIGKCPCGFRGELLDQFS
jgi:hypothetical protein